MSFVPSKMIYVKFVNKLDDQNQCIDNTDIPEHAFTIYWFSKISVALVYK